MTDGKSKKVHMAFHIRIRLEQTGRRKMQKIGKRESICMALGKIDR